MPWFFMHIREARGLVEDSEGSHLPNLDAARAEAADSAREIASERLWAGEPLDIWRFEICDEAGRLLATVPFPGAPGPH